MWPQQCRQNSTHSGPFSRSGLCAPCRQELLRAAGSKGARMGGGRPRLTAYTVQPSKLPSARRAKRRSLACQEACRKCPAAGKSSRKRSEQITPLELPSGARAKRKVTASEQGGSQSETAAKKRSKMEHRYCFRCRRRQDDCRSGGCIPLKYPLQRCNLVRFVKEFDAPDAPMRRSTTAGIWRSCGNGVLLRGTPMERRRPCSV